MDKNKLAYDAHKDLVKKRDREMVSAGQDIGEIPAVVNPRRRKRASANFKYFCKTYAAQAFDLPWSADHELVIASALKALLEGMKQAIAMPRGFGKTTILLWLCLWAVLTGRCKFATIYAATQTIADKLLEELKTILETNELLFEDFPEVCYPVRCLDRVANRQAGQKYKGKHTRIKWNGGIAVLPSIEGSISSGSVLSACGLTGGGIRGQRHVLPNGKVIRPDFALIDDPQTEESAKSDTQTTDRMNLIEKGIAGTKRGGFKMAMFACVTVICKGDLSSRILDRVKSPFWRGIRTQMVKSMPSQMTLWEQYAQTRKDDVNNGGTGSQATAFYKKNKKAMDEGAAIAWKELKEVTDLSALQYAMNIYFSDKEYFFAECQNDPISAQAESDMVTADQIVRRLSGVPRGTVPSDCTCLTFFVDVQKTALFWVLCGWVDGFTGYVVDYGTWPDQKRTYFHMSDIETTMMKACPGAKMEAALLNGLDKLFTQRYDCIYKRADGVEMKIDLALIDANWGESTDIVYKFCTRSRYTGKAFPSHGKFIGASSNPLFQIKRKQGEKVGLHWRLRRSENRYGRFVLIDTNFWKTFVHNALAIPKGDLGNITLFGDESFIHRMFAEHLTAEEKVRVSAKGQELDEWRIKQHKPDNHLFDCLVGCTVAANMSGIESIAQVTGGKLNATKKIMSMAELQKQAKERRNAHS